jgi:hypothetical protein
VASSILTLVAYPIGWAGCGLIWYTIFTKWRHGLSENDDLIMSLGYLLIIAGDIIQAVCYLLMRDFADACATGGWVVLILILWGWKGPPKTKKKIKKLLGDKAKAAKAKMLKKMREAGDHLPKPGEWLPSPVPA